MSDEVLIKRYADAFMEHTDQSIGPRRAMEDLQGVRGVFRDNPDFAEFLKFPDIDNAEKFDVIDKVIKGNFSDEILHFLKLLIAKGRIGMYTDIAEYARVVYSHGAVKDAVLKTTYPLNTGLVERIKLTMEKELGCKLHFYIELDPSLLGGISVKIGNIIYDGSVKKRLCDMRDKLNVLKVA